MNTLLWDYSWNEYSWRRIIHEMNTLKSHLFIFMNIFMNNSQLVHMVVKHQRDEYITRRMPEQTRSLFSESHPHNFDTPCPFSRPTCAWLPLSTETNWIGSSLDSSILLHRMNLTLLSTHSIRSGAALRRCGLCGLSWEQFPQYVQVTLQDREGLVYRWPG